MRKIYVATKFRGFLKELFDINFNEYNFFYRKNKNYEFNSKIKLLLSKFVKSKLADKLGLIQRIKVKKNNYDIAFSYNRFLNTNNKPYIIYLENPTALYHYSLDRNKTFLGRERLKNYLNDSNLKSIVCLSKACYNTLDKFYNIPNHINVQQIYPLVTDNDLGNHQIEKRALKNRLNCLYISSQFYLKGGREILETFRKISLSDSNLNIHLKIITRIRELEEKTLKEIDNLSNVELNDFKYNKEELRNIYNNNDILLNPTRQDSFSLVVLESLKSGNVVISTDLYAIPEMVEDKTNGYLIEPRYRFFDYENLPNEEVWNNRENTIKSNYINKEIVDFLYNKIIYLYNNRKVLKKYSIRSYNKSLVGEFSEKHIKNKWIKLFDKI